MLPSWLTSSAQSAFGIDLHFWISLKKRSSLFKHVSNNSLVSNNSFEASLVWPFYFSIKQRHWTYTLSWRTKFLYNQLLYRAGSPLSRIRVFMERLINNLDSLIVDCFMLCLEDFFCDVSVLDATNIVSTLFTMIQICGCGVKYSPAIALARALLCLKYASSKTMGPGW
jgi:hypothetical protein